MTFDPVMVPWVYAETPALEDLAIELRTAMETALNERFLVIPLASVPQYQDYDAAVYLESCEETQRVECGYVIGQRGNAEWAIVGQMAAGSPGRPPEVLFSFVDVAEARETVSFTAVVTADNHAFVADSVSLVLESVIAGQGELMETRDTARTMWELRQETRDQRRREGTQLEADTGSIDELTRDLAPRDEEQRMTQEDLEAFRGREDGTPWERAGLSEGEFVRYTNSGLTLEEWYRLRSGRIGTLRIRGYAGGGTGPYHHYYDGRYVLSPGDLGFETTAVESYQQLERGGGGLFGFEVAVGVHPWLDVHAGLALRSVQYRAIVYQESEGEPATLLPARQVLQQTTEWRVGATFSPLPTYRFRPTLAAQVVGWSGVAVDQVFGLPADLPTYDAPNGLSLFLSPGAEVTVHPNVNLWGRFGTGFRLGGNAFEELVTGEDLLVQKAEEPDPARGLAFEFVVGVEILVGPLLGAQKPPASASTVQLRQ